jgi:hypothetical protein
MNCRFRVLQGRPPNRHWIRNAANGRSDRFLGTEHKMNYRLFATQAARHLLEALPSLRLSGSTLNLFPQFTSTTALLLLPTIQRLKRSQRLYRPRR